MDVYKLDFNFTDDQEVTIMIYSAEVKGMCPVHQGVHHGGRQERQQDSARQRMVV